MKVFLSVVFLGVVLLGHTARAEDVTVHIIDVGGGLCTLTEAPDGHYMVFDAGVGIRSGSQELCAERIDELMPSGAEIDVLILSHSDQDHISSVSRLLELREVHRVARTGHERATKPWCQADYAIKVEVDGGQRLSNQEYDNRLAHCDAAGQPIFVPLSPYPPSDDVDFNLDHYNLYPGEDGYELGSGAPGEATVTLLYGRHQVPRSWPPA